MGKNKTQIKWFNNRKDWIRYVERYMMNAKKVEGVTAIIIKNDQEQTIASFQLNGNTGVVYEARSPERLEEDINNLK